MSSSSLSIGVDGLYRFPRRIRLDFILRFFRMKLRGKWCIWVRFYRLFDGVKWTRLPE